MQTVHVRVNDAATGKPTPVRIRFTDEAGTYYAPFGRSIMPLLGIHAHMGGNLWRNTIPFAYIDGTCEIDLPPGNITVEIWKGFECLPLKKTIALAAGKLSMRLVMERWIDMRKDHWVSGDTNIQYLSPHAALLEAQGEDVAVANVLASQLHHDDLRKTFPNLLAFSGQEPVLGTGGHIVVVNTINHSASVGTVALLNCHRIVFPLTISPDNIDWTLADWCDQCHRKGGLVVWNPQDQLALSFEAYAQMILGKIDAFGLSSFEDRDLWYHFVSVDARLPLAGESQKHMSFQTLGDMRTYARLPPGEEFTYKNWIEAVRRGTTFATSGPLLTFSVARHEPSIEVHEVGEVVLVRAQASSIIPFGKLEIVANGQIVASADATGFPHSATIEGTFPAASGWWAVRCAGVAEGPFQVGEAHTSPVFLRRENRPFVADPESLRYLLESIDEGIAWATERATFATPKVKEKLLATLHDARKLLASREREPLE